MTLDSNNIKQVKESFDLKKYVGIYLKQWKWFLLSCFIFLALAFIYLRYATPEYNAYAKIMLMVDKASNPAEEILKDLSAVSSSDTEQIDDEIQILKSRKLMRQVVRDLNLNTQIFVKGRIHDEQIFPNNKAHVKINFIESDSIIERSRFNFNVLITSDTTFDFIYKPSPSAQEVSKKMFFGKNVPTPIGDIVITPNIEDVSKLINRTFYIKINTLDDVAEHYKTTIGISPVGKGSNVVNLSLNDPSVTKAKAIINALVDEYNKESMLEKSKISNNTADFINKRIDLIATDLSEVDKKIERFKTGNKLTSITSESELYIQTNAQTEQELASSRTERNMINYMINQISDDSSFDRIPSNVGLSDGSVNSIASKYNELLDNRDRLLKSSNEKHPTIVNLDEQLRNIKSSLKESLKNSSKTVGLQIRSLEDRSSKLSSKIYAVPGQVRQSRDIEREQGIKESIYLFLLQKREEAAISLISGSPNAKVIDEAHSAGGPISPNRKVVFIASLLVGLLIPFGIIYLSNVLDNKIHNKEDLETTMKDIVVLGEIPKIEGNKTLIGLNDRSLLSESFRIVRTNLDFVRRGSDANYNNVIFVTSTVNGEGKSFFSLNMSLTLANIKKKVLLIGADVRNPQILALKNKNNKKERSAADKIGLTGYLADSSIDAGEVISQHDINGVKIDILLSGMIPPNPAELLMSSRVKDLFDTVSKEYDYVIVDTAPSMLVTDTLLISEYAGHTIYVTRAGLTERKILNFAEGLKAENKLNNMMFVVNDVKEANFGYGAKYGYYGGNKKKGLFSKKGAAS